MKDEQIEDLKQFISTVVRNEVASGLSGIRQDIRDLRQDTQAGFAGVGDVLDAHFKQVDEQLTDHETRITTLEHAA